MSNCPHALPSIPGDQKHASGYQDLILPQLCTELSCPHPTEMHPDSHWGTAETFKSFLMEVMGICLHTSATMRPNTIKSFPPLQNEFILDTMSHPQYRAAYLPRAPARQHTSAIVVGYTSTVGLNVFELALAGAKEKTKVITCPVHRLPEHLVFMFKAHVLHTAWDGSPDRAGWLFLCRARGVSLLNHRLPASSRL